MKDSPFNNTIISMLFIFLLLLLSSQTVLAAKPVKEPPPPPPPTIVIYSVVVDYVNTKVVIKGLALSDVAAVSLGGVDVFDDVGISGSDLEIDFTSNTASAVPIAGNYLLSMDNNNFSVYFSSKIIAPPTDGSCPCIAGWEASSIPKDMLSTFCLEGTDRAQDYNIGSGIYEPYTISTAFDPNNIFFNAGDVGSSISYCAATDNEGTNWIVAEPVLSQEQYNDCSNWMWLNVCL